MTKSEARRLFHFKYPWPAGPDPENRNRLFEPDRINATAGSRSTLEGLVSWAGDVITVIAAGLVKVEPTLTEEELNEQLGGG